SSTDSGPIMNAPRTSYVASLPGRVVPSPVTTSGCVSGLLPTHGVEGPTSNVVHIDYSMIEF
ncbi:MAG: hypothetical protein R3178_10185, partial [Rhodothermales bacterium]|nr:hypothetical protein [Rhodothermales bacterium]